MGMSFGTYAGFVPPSVIRKTTGDFKIATREQPQTVTSTDNGGKTRQTLAQKRNLLGSLIRR